MHSFHSLKLSLFLFFPRFVDIVNKYIIRKYQKNILYLHCSLPFIKIVYMHIIEDHVLPHNTFGTVNTHAKLTITEKPPIANANTFITSNISLMASGYVCIHPDIRHDTLYHTWYTLHYHCQTAGFCAVSTSVLFFSLHPIWGHSLWLCSH